MEKPNHTEVNVIDVWEEIYDEITKYYVLTDNALLSTHRPYNLPIVKIIVIHPHGSIQHIYRSEGAETCSWVEFNDIQICCGSIVARLIQCTKLLSDKEQLIADKELLQCELDHVKAYHTL